MKKPTEIESPVLDEFFKNTSLESIIQVSNEMAFINLLSEIGFRDGYWKTEEDELLKKVMKLAKEHSDHQLNSINEHLKRGV